MKHERSRPKNRTQSLDQRLAGDPYLTERMHQIADMREELLAQGCSLDEVDAKVIEQMRLLGKELLGGIAQLKADQAVEQALQKDWTAQRDSKKSNLADHLWCCGDWRRSPAPGTPRAALTALLPIRRAQAAIHFTRVAARAH